MNAAQNETNQSEQTGSAFSDVVAVLNRYFDGLYFSDTGILRQVFHPAAMYACPTGGTLLQLNMDDYFAVVDKRPAPASLGHQREDRIVSIEFAGPGLVSARVQCAILPKRFVDMLSLVHLDGRWQIISKVFHFEVEQEIVPGSSN